MPLVVSSCLSLALWVALGLMFVHMCGFVCSPSVCLFRVLNRLPPCLACPFLALFIGVGIWPRPMCQSVEITVGVYLACISGVGTERGRRVSVCRFVWASAHGRLRPPMTGQQAMDRLQHESCLARHSLDTPGLGRGASGGPPCLPGHARGRDRHVLPRPHALQASGHRSILAWQCVGLRDDSYSSRPGTGKCVRVDGEHQGLVQGLPWPVVCQSHPGARNSSCPPCGLGFFFPDGCFAHCSTTKNQKLVSPTRKQRSAFDLFLLGGGGVAIGPLGLRPCLYGSPTPLSLAGQSGLVQEALGFPQALHVPGHALPAS